MTRRLAWSGVLAAALATAACSLSAVRASASALPPCPPGTDQVASHSGITIDHGLREATVDFALADGCQDVQVSLASYRVTETAGAQGSGPAHQQVLYDVHTDLFSAGEIHELEVDVDPDCYHHVLLVLGAPVEQFGPGSGSEDQRDRTIESKVGGGPRACAGPPPATSVDTEVPDTSAAATETAEAATDSTAPAADDAGEPATAAPPASDPAAAAPAQDGVEPDPAAAGPDGPAADAAGGANAAAPPTTAPAADTGVEPLRTRPRARAAGQLPFTGAGTLPTFLTAGLVLLAAGVALVAGGRVLYRGGVLYRGRHGRR